MYKFNQLKYTKGKIIMVLGGWIALSIGVIIAIVIGISENQKRKDKKE